MKTIDARKHNQQTQYELRKQLVRLRKQGMTNKAATEIVGISADHGRPYGKNISEAALRLLNLGFEAVSQVQTGLFPLTKKMLCNSC